MFTELPRYMGFPSQIWVKKRFAFDSFVRMFNGKRPMMVSTYQFKDRTTPIVDSLIFDIDSYFGLRIPYKNTKSLINFCRENNLKYIANFSVSGDTPLFVKIEDDMKLLPISEVINIFKSGKHVEVLSYDNNKLKFSLVYDYLEHKDYIYKLYHEQSNIPIKLTKHHSIYKWNKGKIKCVTYNNIKVGDYIVSVNQFNKPFCDDVTINHKFKSYYYDRCEEIKITDDLLKLMGYYVSEGHVRNDGLIGFSFNVNETNYHNEVKDLIRRLKPAQHWGDKKKKFNVREQISNKNKSEKQILFSSQKFRTFFEEYCGKGEPNKHIPNFLFNMSKKKFLLFLKCYLNGDGCYKRKYEITAKTTSKQLAQELIWLCKLHGITCSISKYKRNNPNWNDTYTIGINKAELYNKKNNKYHPSPRNKILPIDGLLDVYKQCKPKKFNLHRVEQMSLSKQRANYNRIVRVIKWFDDFKSIEYTIESKEIIENYKKFIDNQDISFLKVKKIVEIEKPIKVYDISVAGSENFFGGTYPMLLHNSGGKGFHLFVMFKPIIPKSEEEKEKLRDLLYSVQKNMVEHCKVEAIDYPTMGRLHWLIRFPTCKYIRFNDENKAENNGLYCRNLSDEEFDSGLKKISKIVTEPGEIPKNPKTTKTIKDIAKILPNFKLQHRRYKYDKINLLRAGNTVPTIEALGIPCLKEIAKHSHPTHYERIELVAWLKFLGYTDLSINAFIRTLKWTRYSYSITSYQVSTVNPRYPKCTFLKESYGEFCKNCTLFKKRYVSKK